ncbi:MAG: hypothetical protein M5R41_06155 [Bacteroidia bacterium]|nr:hypothetical protein [Bacteroidia bacterium]
MTEKLTCLLLVCACLFITAPAGAQDTVESENWGLHRGASGIAFITGGRGEGVALSGRYAYGHLLVLATGRFQWEDPDVPYNKSLEWEKQQEYALMGGAHFAYGFVSVYVAAGPCLVTGTELGDFQYTRVRQEIDVVGTVFAFRHVYHNVREDYYNVDNYRTLGAALHSGIAVRVLNNFHIGIEIHRATAGRFRSTGYELTIIMGTF